MFDPDRPLHPQVRDMIAVYTRGLKVMVNHRGELKRKYRRERQAHTYQHRHKAIHAPIHMQHATPDIVLLTNIRISPFYSLAGCSIRTGPCTLRCAT